MSEQAREALLPDTRAIPRLSVESEVRGNKILVRYRNNGGYVARREFVDRDEANEFFWKCVKDLSRSLPNPKENFL